MYFLALAVAAQVVVTQKNKQFSTEALNVKVGDSVVFKNEDETSHNVFSSSEAFKFNLGVEKPGESQTKTFDAPGEGEIRCAIHPKMKIKLVVTK